MPGPPAERLDGFDENAESGGRAVLLGDLLRERMESILERWVGEVLSSYPAEAAAHFLKQRDPFANPIGHSVREGTRGILQAILYGEGPEDPRPHLDRIIRVRAVQDLTPSQALSFVFELRSVLRAVVPEASTNPRLRQEMARLDEKIDELALMAFDIYAERREEVGRLRVNEVKRQVAWVFEKMNQRDAKAWGAGESPDTSPLASDNVQREDLR